MPLARVFDHRWLMLFLLLAAYVLSFIDRNIMAILVGPIRADFNISDFEYGLLNGLAFSLMYTFLGIPLGWLADRKNRKNIIAVGTAFWSVMTFMCGMATGFTSLFLARVGVGVGEAALSPSAHSLLSDYFEPRLLPVIISIFTLGIPVGVGISYSVGGWVYGMFAGQEHIVLPILGAVKAWQMTFMLVGAPGLLLAVLIYFMREPVRTGMAKVAHVEQTFSMKEVFLYLKQHKRVYGGIYAGVACLAVLGYGFMLWFVAHMSRVYLVPEYEISKTFGVLYLVFGSLGTLFGAWLSGWLSKKAYADAGIRTVIYVAALWLIPAIAAPLMPNMQWALIAAAPCIFLLNAYFGVAIASLQQVTPNQMRAQVSAVLLFMGNVFGLAIGPAIIGFFSDVFFSGSHSLGYALSLCGLLFCPLALISLRVSLAPYRQMLQAQAAV